jgi:hypothetical protein
MGHIPKIVKKSPAVSSLSSSKYLNSEYRRFQQKEGKSSVNVAKKI